MFIFSAVFLSESLFSVRDGNTILRQLHTHTSLDLHAMTVNPAENALSNLWAAK
jgi:hypothetical protein